VRIHLPTTPKALTTCHCRYILANRPFLGICIGLQTLFEESEESPGVAGLGIIPGKVSRFRGEGIIVPQIGWNGVNPWRESPMFGSSLEECRSWGEDQGASRKLYFVHSFRAEVTAENRDWVLASTDYGGSPFVAAVQRGNVAATQFHPEKSGPEGIALLRRYLTAAAKVASGDPDALAAAPSATGPWSKEPTVLARRIVACLDVRSNDHGDLVVTKGDQYDVREKTDARGVRNLGRPVDLAARYYDEGADEVAFLNITAFREMPLEEQPMLEVMEQASTRVFVPMTVGGGIRDYTDSTGKTWSALDVAARYFRAGADKVSIGSDAVIAAEEFWARGGTAEGTTCIEQIARVYGSQAVVISIDPRRVYVLDPSDAPHKTVVEMTDPARFGPAGERFAWYQCTVRGGREGRDMDANALARACEAMGAGELLVNCVDEDGQKRGFDADLMADLCKAVHIPVVASSGAGAPGHFVSIFKATRSEAALAAGIFHRREVSIDEVKAALEEGKVPCRAAAGRV
jgi:imidazole glycerol-phosphate synthase